MDWKKVIDSEELIVLEKKNKKAKLKIEARLDGSGEWHIYKSLIKENRTSLISEHILDDKHDVEKLIEKLKHKTGKQSRKFKLELKRDYKEDMVEKWYFEIDNIRNMMVVKYDELIYVDMVMNEKLRIYEKKIISIIEDRLGLKNLCDAIQYDIYYFDKKNSKLERNEQNLSFMDIEFNFDE